MCQAAPGPRCYNDSNRKLSQLENRGKKLKKDIETIDAAIKTASGSEGVKLSQIRKLTEQKKALASRLTSIETEYRHTQRDVDGTLTGRRVLQEQINKTNDPNKVEALEVRLRAGAALRFARETALEWSTSGRPAPIRLISKAA